MNKKDFYISVTLYLEIIGRKIENLAMYSKVRALYQQKRRPCEIFYVLSKFFFIHNHRNKEIQVRNWMFHSKARPTVKENTI